MAWGWVGDIYNEDQLHNIQSLEVNGTTGQSGDNGTGRVMVVSLPFDPWNFRKMLGGVIFFGKGVC